MTDQLSSFAFQLAYLFTHLTLANVVDIALVASILFVVFQALYQTRALQLLRGATAVAILGLVLLLLLPLNTFNWLLRGLLLAGAIALPLLFHDELRRGLTSLGQLGGRWDLSTDDRFIAAIVSACTRLAARREGALIVLEGKTPLAKTIASGIPVQAETLTAELLETIFSPKTPLHDGAVILRGQRLVAASCILPVETAGTGETHLGTRHRAAIGLSARVPDTLAIVVSGESGHISVAREGQMHRDLLAGQLEEWLDRFQGQTIGQVRTAWQQFPGSLAGWLRGASLRTTLWNLVMAIGLALIAWVSVVYQTYPPQQVTVANVPLTVTSPASDLVSMQDLPGKVSVQVQTTRDRVEALDATSIQAEAVLAELPAGVHRVGVKVTLADERAQVVSIMPEFVDVILEPLATRTLPPTVATSGVDALPPGYTLHSVSLTPETVSVQGARSLLDQVATARVSLALNDRRTDFQQSLPVELLDGSGELLATLQPTPDTVLVTVSITRTFDTREAAVQARLETGSLERGYQVTAIRLSPPEVTLAGQEAALDEAGDFVATTPINLAGIFNSLVADVPLILPEGVLALNYQGESVTSVVARVTVSPAAGYLVLGRVPTLSGVLPSLSARLSPGSVTVLLVGPEPLLAQVEKEPSLVRVSLSLAGYEPGSYLLPLEAQAPEGLRVELFPAEVNIVLAEEGPEEPLQEVE